MAHPGGRSWAGFVRASSLLLLLLLAGAADAAPRRIVSMNPCADAILDRLVEPHRIAGISHWSHDPAATSMPLDRARRLPAHGGTAEEVIRLRPDLVIAGIHTPAATRWAFARLGVPVVTVGVPASVTQSLAEIRRLAAVVGEPAAGEALVAEIEGTLDRARTAGPPVAALLRTPAGVVPGAGTLIADVMARTGFRNAAGDLGLAAWDVLPLERLLLAPPAVLFVDGQTRPHPALARLEARLRPFPMRLLNCGGPTITALARTFAAERRAFP